MWGKYRNLEEITQFLIEFWATVHKKGKKNGYNNKKKIKNIDFYNFMVKKLKFTPCENEENKEYPQYWPIIQWIKQLNETSISNLKKYKKEIKTFIPKKEIKKRKKSYHKKRKKMKVRHEPLCL